MNPYPGLRPFEEEDFHLFFGRDEQIDELLERLSLSRFLCVTGVSGSGKSSLVKAGLIPALRRGYEARSGSRWRVAKCRPGDDPISSLAKALREDAQLASDLERSSHGLVHAAQYLLPEESLLVVVDQFEELFRYREKFRADDEAARREKARNAERAADFVRLLLTGAADQSVPAYVVLTMRSDYLGDCAQFRDLPEALNGSQYLIPRMTRDQRREAIERPLGRAPISAALVQQILNDAGDEPNQLPVLQHVLMRTWEEWNKQGEIDLDDYTRAGGFEDTLNRHAQNVYEALDARGRQVAEHVFKRLAVRGAAGRETRSPAKLSVLWAICGADSPDEQQHVTDVIEHFRKVAGTFLTSKDDELGANSIIDITHESLIERWKTLREWVRQEEESAKLFLRLLEDAKVWRHNPPELLRGLYLTDAEKWNLQRNPNPAWALEYADSEKDADALQLVERYIGESRTQEHRNERRRKWVLAGLTAVAFLFGGLAAVAYYYADSAKKNASTALVRQLAANAQGIRADGLDLELPTLLATESMKRSPLLDNDRELRLDTSLLPRTRWSVRNGRGVDVVEFSPDGRWVATGSWDHTARVFETDSGKEVSRLTEQDRVVSVAFSPNGQWVATGSSDHTARVFEAGSGKEVSRLTEQDRVVSVAFSPDGQWVAVGGSDHTARVFEAVSGKESSRLTEQNAVLAVAFSPDGRSVATGSRDNTARVFDVGSGKQVWCVTEQGPVLAVAFSQDGHWVTTGSSDNTARVFKASTGKEVSRLTEHGPVEAVAFSPDGRLVATGSDDNTARVFEAGSGKEVSRLTEQGTVWAVAFSPDGRWVATGCNDKTARVFEAFGGKEVSHLTEQNSVWAVAFSPNGRWVATGSYDATARLFEASGKQVSRLVERKLIEAVALSPDGRWVATASDDQNAQVFDAETEQEESRLTQQGTVLAAAFSPDGQWVATGSEDDTARVFEAGSGKQVWRVTEQDPVNAVAFSPDGRWVATGSDDNTARVFEAGSGKQVWRVTEQDAVNAVAFSPDERWMATGSDDNTARVFEAGSGKQVWRVTEQDAVNAVAFSPDGRWVATGSDDHTSRVFESATGREIARVRLPSEVFFVSFTPDGHTVIAGTSTAAHVIDVAASQETSRIQTDGEVGAVRFVEGGRYVELAVLGPNEVRITRHAIRLSDLMEDACSRVTRNLTVAEWKDYVGPTIPYRRTCENRPFPPDYSAATKR